VISLARIAVGVVQQRRLPAAPEALIQSSQLFQKRPGFL
jgi:hypothetical protein